MNLKAALGCFLIITMNTVVSDIFIFGLDMVFKLSFVRHCKITAVHDIFIFMFCLWVNSKASFGCCLVLTMNTAVYDIFMFGLNMLFQILFGRCRKNAFFTIKSYIFMLWFYMSLKVLLGFCHVVAKVATENNILTIWMFFLKVFLASPDALEVIVVTDWLTHFK